MTDTSRSRASVRSLHRSLLASRLAYLALGLALAALGYFLPEVGRFVVRHLAVSYTAFFAAVVYLLLEMTVWLFRHRRQARGGRL